MPLLDPVTSIILPRIRQNLIYLIFVIFGTFAVLSKHMHKVHVSHHFSPLLRLSLETAILVASRADLSVMDFWEDTLCGILA